MSDRTVDTRGTAVDERHAGANDRRTGGPRFTPSQLIRLEHNRRRVYLSERDKYTRVIELRARKGMQGHSLYQSQRDAGLVA